MVRKNDLHGRFTSAWNSSMVSNHIFRKRKCCDSNRLCCARKIFYLFEKLHCLSEQAKNWEIEFGLKK